MCSARLKKFHVPGDTILNGTPTTRATASPRLSTACAPDWVTRGCSAFWGDDHPSKLCGVGSFGGTRNHSLAVTGAQGRGRTAIARSLDLHVKAMLKDYQSTTAGAEKQSDEQHVTDVSKQITDFSLSGTEMKDFWISQAGTVYALVVLDVDKFTDSVSRMNHLSEEIRAAVEERARSSFKELDGDVQRERLSRRLVGPFTRHGAGQHRIEVEAPDIDRYPSVARVSIGKLRVEGHRLFVKRQSIREPLALVAIGALFGA